MDQETTALHAEELFGDYFNFEEFTDSGKGFEKYWEWPETVGKGFMYVVKLRPGLMMGYGNYRLHRTLEVDFEFNFSPVTFGFSLSGNLDCSVKLGDGYQSICGYDHGYSTISYMPECPGTATQPSNIPVRCVGIWVDPDLLKVLLSGQQVPKDLGDIINRGLRKFYHRISGTSPRANMSIQQILNCPYQSPLKRLYLEGKVIELITHSMAQFTLPEPVTRKTDACRPDDVERVIAARHVLIKSYDNPPSLTELARQVGTNKTKLNQGFRQVYGTSAFAYLRNCRLERARKMLETKEMTVTQVAYEVGYSQQSTFTKAFQNHYGTNPRDHMA